MVAVFIVIIVILEGTLTLFKDELGLEASPTQSHLRYLRLREWPPNKTLVYKAPETRKNDPLGPVDEIYRMEIDQHGFIKPSIVHTNPDAEIVFIGGSTTECLYVRPEARFPFLVGQLLEERLKLKVNGINAGKSGNHTMHSLLAFLGKVAPRKPAFVVLMHATNDIGVLNAKKSYWNDRPGIEIVLVDTQIKGRRPVRDFIRKARDALIPYTYQIASTGVRVIRERLSADGDEKHGQQKQQVAGNGRNKTGQAPSPDRETKRRRIIRASFEPALRSFVRTAKAWGSQPVLMTQILVKRRKSGGTEAKGEFLSPDALKRGDFDASSFDSIHAFANAIVRHVALSEGAILIDLARAREWSNEDVYDGLHFTETGSRRVANTVASKLADLVAKHTNAITSRASVVR